MGLKKVYWIGLVKVIVIACDYLNDHWDKLPTEVQYGMTNLRPVLQASCDFIKGYDASHSRGPNTSGD